jgi:hypothetical protein
MSAQLILCLERNVAFCFAGLIRANDVCLREMDLQICVFLVINVFVVVPAQVADEMVSAKMVEEHQVIEVEFLAEVAVGMR